MLPAPESGPAKVSASVDRSELTPSSVAVPAPVEKIDPPLVIALVAPVVLIPFSPPAMLAPVATLTTTAPGGSMNSPVPLVEASAPVMFAVTAPPAPLAISRTAPDVATPLVTATSPPFVACAGIAVVLSAATLAVPLLAVTDARGPKALMPMLVAVSAALVTSMPPSAVPTTGSLFAAALGRIGVARVQRAGGHRHIVEPLRMDAARCPPGR